MLLPKNNTPRWIIVMIDLFMSLVAIIFAYLIRFDLRMEPELFRKEWKILSHSILIIFAVKAIVFVAFKIHKGIVRHTSTEDLRRIVLATLSCTLIFIFLGFIRKEFFDGFYLMPTTVLIVEFLATTMLMLTFRFGIKLLYLESIKSKNKGPRVLIYGAGISGLITKRTIEKDPLNSYQIIGFLDDSKKLSGNIIEGVTIFHTSKLKMLVQDEDVDTVILAIQDPDKENTKEVIDYCVEHNVSVQKVPNPKSWINGEFSAKQLKKIKIEDLLGRSEIKLDKDKIKEEIQGKVVLVTGAAGSIGSGMVRQMIPYEPQLLILLDYAESGLYDFVNELKSNYPNAKIEPIIGDIRNYDRMNRVFEFFKPEYILHAAAYKHVPLMEDNPSEAILTNVKGTKNLVDLALHYKAHKFVMISTDKAVNPTNVMGASKRIAEIYAQKANKTGSTKFITTRFGNVLGSNGSVIPLFQRQIENGGPVTVTDDRITRFFMTIPEACQLVLEAGTIGDGGEIFVFDMGESVKIIDLAKKMIKLSGLELGKDIEIKISGLRPGEKLYEELLSDEENTIPTHHPKILKAKMKDEGQDQLQRIEDLIALFDNQENESIVAKMKEIVPEFKSNNSIYEKLDK